MRNPRNNSFSSSTKFRFSLIVGVFLALTCTIHAQVEDWLRLYDKISYGQALVPLPNGDFINIIGDSKSTDFVFMRLTKDNEEVWSSSVLFSAPQTIIHGNQLTEDAIILFTIKGNIYKLMPSTSEIMLLNNVSDFDTHTFWHRSQKVTQFDQYYIIDGLKKDTSGIKSFFKIFDYQKNLFIYHSEELDPNSCTVRSHLSIEKFVEACSHEDFLTVSMLDTHKTTHWVWSDSISQISVSDMMIGTDSTIYLIGQSAVKDIPTMRQGELMSFSTNGDFNWRVSFAPRDPWTFIGSTIHLDHLAQFQDSSIIVMGYQGVHGFGPVSDLFVADISHSGEVLWEYERHIEGDADIPADLYVSEQTAVIIGTAAETDYGGPQRAFILKLDNLPPPPPEPEIEECIVYPNPVFDKLQIRGFGQDIQASFTITDLLGHSVMFGTLTIDNINVLPLIAGMYHLSIKTDDKHYENWFIKL